jgi:hypothetical protein
MDNNDTVNDPTINYLVLHKPVNIIHSLKYLLSLSLSLYCAGNILIYLRLPSSCIAELVTLFLFWYDVEHL